MSSDCGTEWQTTCHWSNIATPARRCRPPPPRLPSTLFNLLICCRKSISSPCISFLASNLPWSLLSWWYIGLSLVVDISILGVFTAKPVVGTSSYCTNLSLNCNLLHDIGVFCDCLVRAYLDGEIFCSSWRKPSLSCAELLELFVSVRLTENKLQ